MRISVSPLFQDNDIDFTNKRMIYWWVNKSGKTCYYLDKNRMFRDWGNVKNLLNSIDKYNLHFYELETVVTDDILLALLNKEFNHCMLPNYMFARRIIVDDEIEY